MKSVIETFYNAFKNKDWETMIACYHEDVHFEDPAFGILKGDRACNMWRMLISSQKGKDFEMQYSNIHYSNNTGTAHWEAQYTFSQTGRKVHNKIDGTFEFKDGKIIKHIDDFNLRSWATQAMGLKGRLLGGTGFFKKKLNAQTNKLLDTFLEQNK